MDPLPDKLVRNPDGSISRLPAKAIVLPAGMDASAGYKDVVLDPTLNTVLRLYLPSDLQAHERVPVILYFHGGGFVRIQVSDPESHRPCLRLAADVRAVVVSVDYRLAPEHRLPAAYDDAMDAFRWLQNQADAGGDLTRNPDTWVVQHADFSRCFLAGMSAGGNIAFNLACRVAALPGAEQLIATARIAGVIMDQPFFGGVERTGSEERSQQDPVIPPAKSDLFWELSLPEGADRDHEYSNPMAQNNRQKLLPLSLPICLVRCHKGDVLIDRQLELVRMLEEMGVDVVVHIAEGGMHGVEFFDSNKADDMITQIGEFVNALPANTFNALSHNTLPLKN